MRYKNIFLVLVGLVFLSLFVFKDAVLYRLGVFLVVDQPIERVDVAVATSITEKVLRCYKAGNCRKIIIIVSGSDMTWWSGEKNINEANIREQAEKFGIDPADLSVFADPGRGIPYVTYLRELLLEKGMQSAVVYVGYHKGRRHRFYLDRYLGNRGVVAYVQPINPNNDYMRDFDYWWKNTALDNLFLDEYLGMLFYYFNKALWSSAV